MPNWNNWGWENNVVKTRSYRKNKDKSSKFVTRTETTHLTLKVRLIPVITLFLSLLILSDDLFRSLLSTICLGIMFSLDAHTDVVEKND